MTSNTFKLLVLPGDHVGPEVINEALRVLDVVEESRPGLKFERTFDVVGGSSIDKHGVPITQEVLEKATQSDAVLFGSVGGPKWADASPNPESGLLQLRHKLDAFANLRPCEIIVPSLLDASPLKPDIIRGTKFIVVRENCGGAYFGTKVETPDVASDLWVYRPHEVERCARVSAAVARLLGKSGDGKGGGGPAVVWSADKANVLASGRLWRRVTEDTFKKEFPDVELRHQLADSMAMLMVKNPRGFNGVIHTDNTFGDILSDISGGIVGSLGTLPSASISGVPGEGKCNGIYEPVHGSAPDIAGKGIVNPVAQILSLAMLLRYSCLLTAEAAAIESAVQRVFEPKEAGGFGIRTKDMGGNAGTREVGDAVCQVLRGLLSRE
ncbi:isocitrate/isopropylmalate dehydrogenase family protein [Metarhizium robertsii]|uniref:3-isopropylmalate dehydrogenase n=2 Tax=Metarhizium robertsii TaxID=568076 RepID=E9EUV6_METRA|nr:Isopropylmalate dehydrogenase [Metarhizium robertsii ARSEF 23]EFZ01209.1 Isopropylmalate dehydrogenase [Metarhizium robertsii ARSEF 23]EXV03780.1 isocitrate/isopropylmalate dehydrogenase family protein [Metarhizium robertsii]